MKRLEFSARIDAPREKVWETMLDDSTYRQWTSIWAEGSHYVGDWSEGSRILFLAPGENGPGGMVSRIRESRLHELVSIEHLGVIQDGEEDTSSEAVAGWAGAQENYHFREVDGGTELRVELDTADEYEEMFENTWPKALAKLKELAEA